MKRFEFRLDISPERYLSYYRGTVSQVVVQCFNGVSVQFPASMLTQFVSTGGVRGNFVLTCDDNFKSSHLQRLAAHDVK
ncbi:DUF2835 family protein [Rhodoferax sp.]|uniref:DUF2835 family protein n=1 Tax=Rhodoferax sp. TaxID=50421 RepID=UPI00386B8C77